MDEMNEQPMDQPVSPPVQPASSSLPPPAPARKSRLGLILVLLLIAFVGGVAVAIWGPKELARRWGKEPESAALMDAEQLQLAQQPVSTFAQQDVAALEARVASLSARMDVLSSQAQNAGAYASRAEALMIAFAARRALDNGAPLGYIENELRVRFAEGQPRAVTTIITAAREPVTLADLQAGLTEATPALMGTAPDASWWEATKRELSSLIVMRKASSPSRVPQKALEQARALLLAGRVEAALAEVERLPGRSKADAWVQMARRYNEARRALDVIEAAAILEPRSIAAPAKAAATDEGAAGANVSDAQSLKASAPPVR